MNYLRMMQIMQHFVNSSAKKKEEKLLNFGLLQLQKKGVFAIYVLTKYKAEDDLTSLIVQLKDRTNEELLERKKRGG